MKQNNIFKLLLMGAGLLFLNACSNLIPVENPIEEIIANQETRIEVLGLRTETDTKVTLTGATYAWKKGDTIAVWTGTDAEHYGTAGGYQKCIVAADGSLPVTLAAGYERYNYALYPANIMYAGGKADFTPTGLMVVLPKTYSYDDVCGDNVQQPMIAFNDRTKSNLTFYNLASILRLEVTLPKRTVKLKIKFNPDCMVNGRYYVTPTSVVPGTACIDSSRVFDGSNVISITGIHDIPVSDSTIIVNVPIPVDQVNEGYNDFSISAWDDAGKAIKAELVHMASDYNPARGHGKQLKITLTQGTFKISDSKYCIVSPSNLMYDGTKPARSRYVFHDNAKDVCTPPAEYKENSTYDQFYWLSASDDWGNNNVISSYKKKTWNTPEKSQWEKIITYSNHIHVPAKIDDVKGFIILPIGYSGPAVVVEQGNNKSYDNNPLTNTAWAEYAAAGAMFLPERDGVSGETAELGNHKYWSSTSEDKDDAYCCVISGLTLHANSTDYADKDTRRCFVRLIHIL